MRILTAAEARSVDTAAIDEFGIPGVVLMEHAARAVADAVRERLGPGRRVAVVAGAGNNAGDGYAAARLLSFAGLDVRVIAVVPPEKLQGDAAVNAVIWSKAGGRTEPWVGDCLGGYGAGDVIVDAIFGTGLARPPEGLFATAIGAINGASARGATVVAVDLPSGLSADTGRALGVAVKAAVTVTFGALKRGLVLHPGAVLAGEVRVAEISIPPQAFARVSPPVRLLREASVRGLLHARQPDAHKGTFGHVLAIAGSEGKSGAAAMAALAALVGGAGLASVATRAAVVPQILAHAMELMAVPLDGDGPLAMADADPLLAAAEGKGALLIGPGIPRGPETGTLIGRLLAEVDCPVLLDADALNALQGKTSLLKGAATEVVITPHPGEMSRLAGIGTAAVQEDRIGVAQRFAREHSCTVVLKGAGTVIADAGGEVAICPTGNPGMATGGTGDILSGLIAALLAQGLPGFAAARAGVYVHGLAGDLRAKVRGQAGLVASELLTGIGEVWAAWNL